MNVQRRSHHLGGQGAIARKLQAIARVGLVFFALLGASIHEEAAHGPKYKRIDLI